MKGRQTILYLLVLLLVGGYFYYFEVIRTEQKEAAEKEAKKVFHIQSADIQALQIDTKGKKPVQLKKEAQWRIVEPVKADLDQAPLQDMLNTLSNLESTREVAATTQELKPYGLEDPALKIRFQVPGQSAELIAGDKNPAGDGRYAKVADKPAVFLIAEGQWNLIAKGLDELRKRDLFTFKTDEATGIKVTWQNGNSVNVEKQAEGSAWKSTELPELKLKNTKVNNLLDQVHFLRATAFLEEAPSNLQPLGLESPLVRVSIRLKDGTTVDLRLAKDDKDPKMLVALSSQLPAAVLLDGGILHDLPVNTQSLEDRSLLSLNRDEIKQVKWQWGEASGEAVQTAPDNWSVKRGDKDSQPLKESWRIKSLLWDLNDFEYLSKPNPEPEIPQKPFVRLELWTGEKMVASFAWDQPQDTDTKPPTLWVARGDRTEAVQVESKAIQTLQKDLGQILQGDLAK